MFNMRGSSIIVKGGGGGVQAQLTEKNSNNIVFFWSSTYFTEGVQCIIPTGTFFKACNTPLKVLDKDEDQNYITSPE